MGLEERSGSPGAGGSCEGRGGLRLTSLQVGDFCKVLLGPGGVPLRPADGVGRAATDHRLVPSGLQWRVNNNNNNNMTQKMHFLLSALVQSEVENVFLRPTYFKA